MTAPVAKTGFRLESRAATLERFVERHHIWILAIWSLIYFAGTMLRAHGKPFWYDELLTVLEARQPTLPQALQVLRDVDWMPPAERLTFYFTDKLAGSGEVAFRIPVMISFWVFCISLYLFARRRVSIFLAFMALLLPYASEFQMYSYEARSYAFMLAFCGIALVSWQAAAEGIARPGALSGLALALAAAVSFQYWSALMYLPLGAAEVYRAIRRRRVDWSMCGALAVGATPLVASFFLLRRLLQGTSPHRAHAATYLEFYSSMFRLCLFVAVLIALALSVWFLIGGRKEKPEGSRLALIPDYEWIAVAVLLLAPVAVISITMVLPPYEFMPRYAAPAVAGYALLIAFLAAHFSARRSALGLVCVLAALAPFLYLMTHPKRSESPFHKMRGLQRQLQNGPVVIEGLVSYLPLWYYAPDPLKPRLIFLTGRQSATRSPDRMDEFSKLGIPVVPYNKFALPGTEFLFYPGKSCKLQRRIERDGGTVETVASSRRHPVLRAHIP